MIKKYILFSAIAALLLAGCNPNEELYNELDKKTSDAYTDQFDYTLTEEDYSTITDLALEDAETAEDSGMISLIEEHHAFGDEFAAADYIPKFLGNKYVALDQGSSINITYNYMGSVETLSTLSNATYYTLTEADYDSMGEGEDEPGEYDNFAYDVSPEDYLPGFLDSKYPNAEDGDLVAVTYDYYDNGVSEVTDFYSYEGGSWQPGGLSVSNFYVMGYSDYNSIGGAVANFGSFDSDNPPDKYLPTFLKEKYPYAEEGDVQYVVYTYYVGYDTKRASKYYFDGDTWKPYQEVSNQFIKGDEKWVFDPTVRFEISSSDYQLIVDQRESKYVDSYGTAEFYSGASAYHGNFSLRIPDRVEYDPDTFEGLDEAEAKEIMWNRIVNMADEPMATRGALIVLLQNKFPNAQPKKNGVDVYYEVSFQTYNNDRSSSNYTVTYQCTASGSPAEFTYVEGNTPYSE